MMQINTLIKKAIKRLEREGKTLTPDFYAEAFCKEAKLAGVEIDDCKHVAKLVSTLSPKLQQEIKNYRLQTLNELARFLIAKLNRTNPTTCSEYLETQISFTKSLLKALQILHNKEARFLASRSLELLNESPSVAQIEHFKQLWENFVANYDDTFLEKLKAYGEVDRNDLKKTIENLRLVQKQTAQAFDLKKISRVLIASLTPSISSKPTEQIETLIEKLKQNPEGLLDEDTLTQLKEAIRLRIALDKSDVKAMVSSLESIMDKLSARLLQMIEQSDGSNAAIAEIKKDLEALKKEEREINFQLAHKKLYTIAVALQEHTIGFRSDLQGHSKEVEKLQERVRELELQLKKAQEEAKRDFLTNLYNKRALEEFLELKEGEFKRYGRNFSVAMLDLDHFKKVNDLYGHDAGDIVLKSFASILKRDSRDVDIIGRFGGEEFMAILGDTDLEGAVVHANKIREHIENAKFMYKGKRIVVTVSIGVAQRKDHLTLEQTIKKADENLYKAKSSGRNKVVY